MLSKSVWMRRRDLRRSWAQPAPDEVLNGVVTKCSRRSTCTDQRRQSIRTGVPRDIVKGRGFKRTAARERSAENIGGQPPAPARCGFGSRGFARPQKRSEEKFWSDVESWKGNKGTVKSMTDYGAYRSWRRRRMIHISEMSWNKVRHPSQVFKMGDVVEVFVKDIDLKRKRFRCYKKDEDNP